MRTPAYLCLLLTCMLISCTPMQEKHEEIDYTSYVNHLSEPTSPEIPILVPKLSFGMVQLSRITDFPDGIVSPVILSDSTIAGFNTRISPPAPGWRFV